MLKSYRIVALFLLFPVILFSQDIQPNQTDTAYINSLNDRSFKLLKKNADSSALLATEAIYLSEKINYLRGLGDAYLRLGILQKDQDHYEAAISLYKKSLGYRKQLGNRDLIGRVQNNIGVVFKKKGDYDSAIYYSLQALSIADSLHDEKNITIASTNLAAAYQSNDDYPSAEVYYKRSLDVAVQLNDTAGITRAFTNLGSFYYMINNYKAAISYCQQAIKLATLIDDQQSLATANGNLGNVYNDMGKVDSALFYLNTGASIDSALGRISDWATYLSDIGLLYLKSHNYLKAIEYIQRSAVMSDSTGNKKLSATNYENLAVAYNAIGDPVQAYNSMLKFKAYNDSVYNKDKAKAISDMQTKYETEKKQQQIDLLSEKNKVAGLQRNIFMAGAIVLFAIAIGLFVFFRQKQQIATKNDRIQKQQIGELLNTQEIKSLNSMMEGQEKERKRIAEDLHDRVGSSLAAIKLHMNSVARMFNISEDSSEQFYRVNSMFDDVVKEVRQVSHDLASGVLMKFGLVPALRDLCESIESAGHQKVQVITHGMDERLDNQSEIAIYRIVQECIGNILKHANAKEIQIQLTRLEQSFMLMVEDDGVGFDPQKIASDGMGLKNIRTRVQQLNGTVHFDSSPGKGATTTVEIPFNTNSKS